MANSTKKPTGLAIARDGNLKFAISWKIADKDYGGGHQLRYRGWKSEKKHTAWTTVTMGAKATSKTITLALADWYPSANKPKLYYFEYQVRGKRNTADGKNYDWSAWADKKWKIAEPPAPTVSASLTAANSTTFSWSVAASNADNKPFRETYYQTILVKACKETDGSKLKWGTSSLSYSGNTGGASGSLVRTEDSTLLAADSYTRWFRACARGAKGASAWKYAKHVYARPYAATIETVSAKVNGSLTNVYVKWKAAADAAHPIDETSVEYVMATPLSGLVCPGTSPTTAVTQKDTGNTDAASFSINGTVGEDECLWLRVVNKHDANETASDWKLAQKGKLAEPTALTVSLNSTTFIASVTVATNASDVPDSQLALVYRGDTEDIIVGILPHGTSTLNNVQVPAGTTSPAFGIFAFQGTATAKTRADGVTVYSVNANMKSDTFWRGGDVPSEPGSVTADTTETAGEVLLTWAWAWSEANQAELSWSTNPNAWESTDEPQTYLVDSTHAARWRISGLAAGQTWYFRIRLVQNDGNNAVYGPYSEQLSVNLASAPAVPVLTVSNAIIAPGGALKATWEYESTDGTQQVAARVNLATVSGSGFTVGAQLGNALTAQHIDIDTTEWTTGAIYYLTVCVTSASGKTSGWSDPVPVFVAEPITCEITQTNITNITVEDSDGETRAVAALTEMPLTATIHGAGAGGVTTLIVERSESYPMLRPDGSVRDGYEGETIALWQQTGDAQIVVNTSDLIGRLDDGASYVLIATVEDGFGQSDSVEIPFEVHWSEQAVIPEATITTQNGVAVITPTAEAEEGATCDIYRLSTDSPQIIVRGGTFGTAYVDPFPAVGEHGGYRIVYITADGDYITADNQPAWTDYTGGLFDNKTGYIHFNGEIIPVQFNVQLTSAWRKDFKETQYLGGTVRGDWNPAVSRTGTINVTIPTDDVAAIEQMRRLADWNGICHVRTQDGSSYAADIEVSSDTSYSVAGRVEIFNLSITRVDPESLDGLTLAEYNE